MDILLNAFVVSAIGGIAVFGIAELNQWWTPEVRIGGFIGYEAADLTAFVLIGNAMARSSRRRTH